MANEITNNRKAILVTPELCIGCRACQVACKSWNQLPGIKTKNNGTYQNPPDLASAAFNIIQYSEVPSQGKPRALALCQQAVHALRGRGMHEDLSLRRNLQDGGRCRGL